MPEKMLWSTWSARAWPMSVTEEVGFRRQLGVPASKFDRDDVSFMCTALRCGADVTVIRDVAPGLDLSRLAAAYDAVDEIRRAATAEFQELLDLAGEADDLATVELSAGRLMPVVVGRIVTTHGDENFHREHRRIVDLLEHHRRIGEEVEERLVSVTNHDVRRVIAVELHNPFGLGLWGHPYYLPRRVTDLSPGRLRDLLGEGE